MSDFLDGLNPPQRQAVLHTEGPLMIIAGAGSGKTRVLTLRIAHLLQKGVDPFNILSLTFTNKAAREMRNRIEKQVGPDARNLWMGTFHSVFARILRSESEKIGYPNNFTIYDTDDAKSLLRTIIKELNLDDKVYKVSNVLGRISMSKNKLISWREYQNNAIIQADDKAALRPELGRIYQMYQQRCFRAGAMDFDDLLFNTNILFRDHLDVLNKYQNKFKYVMVDEFQDTNISQYLITRKLAAQSQNICVVGDDAQSIYAFRGADIQNILNFKKDYSDLVTVKLEQNYRSTVTIVEAANSIIKNNKAQLQKNVWTSNDHGSPITVLRASSDNEEGKLVANSIFEDRMQKSLVYDDFAILYRTNSQSRAMEEGLRKLNIPYRLVGGTSFYQRKEIKDIISYLRYAMNHNDEEALKRIINYPKRGIGDTTIAKLIVFAGENNLALWDVISNISKYMSGRSADAIEQFATTIKSFRLIIETKDAFEATQYVCKTSGILQDLSADKSIEGLSRIENVNELLNAVKAFVDNDENEDKSLAYFLQEVALVTDVIDDKTEEDDKVTLMTIHSSKGLEYKQVYIVGLEEDLFPSQMMMSSREDLEEERRLFYVAVTRAEHKLVLSYANSRYRFGQIKSCEPSRFLNEIDPRYISMPQKFSGFADSEDGATFAKIKLSQGIKPRPANPQTATSPTMDRPKVGGVRPAGASTVSRPSAPTQSPNQVANQTAKNVSETFSPSPVTELKKDQRVEHQKFGRGVILDITSTGNDSKAIINFDEFGQKTMLLSFAKLMIL